MDNGEYLNNINSLVDRYDALKKHDPMDLSTDQDLTIAIMNLIGIEEHLFFTGAKTERSEYFALIKEIRSMRKELLQKIVGDHEGEVWCLSKHLLAASYRLMEVGTKKLDQDAAEEAQDFFTKAYNLYSLFWGLAMKIVPSDELKNLNEESIPKEKRDTLFAKLGEMVKKAVNCCIE